MWSTLFTIVVILVVLFVGFSLINGRWLIKKDETGTKIPLNKNEKIVVGGSMTVLIIAVLGFFFHSNPPWLQRMRQKHSR